MAEKSPAQRGTAVVITLGADLESALNDLAREQGVAPEALALNALRERFLGPDRRVQPRDEWERHLLGGATDCGVAPSHEAVGSEGLYE
jgi:hypothetical protein